MPSVFPGAIDDFPTMLDIIATDAPLLKLYQQAVEEGNLAQAAQYLAQIPNYQKKIVNATLLNNILDATKAVERYFQARYSPAYVVSTTQPTSQDTGDFWFKVVE